MKQRFFITTMVLLVAYLLSACGGAPQPAEQPAGDQAAIKVQAVEVAFTGVVEAMNGNEWTVNGQVLSVDPAVVRDGPFQAGDTIKVEGTVNADGSLTVSRVEAPSAADLTDLPQLGNDNVNANSNDTNSNAVNTNANSNDTNTNDANANTNSNDDNSNDDSANANTNDDNTNDDSANVNSNDDSTNTNLNSNDDQGNSNGNADDDDGGSNGGNGNGSDDGGGSQDDSDDGGGNSNDD